MVQEATMKVTRMPTSGPMHEQAAGTRDDQACHRRHREGQVADEESVMEGARVSTRGHCDVVDRGGIEVVGDALRRRSRR
jgi:hypothetical protein